MLKCSVECNLTEVCIYSKGVLSFTINIFSLIRTRTFSILFNIFFMFLTSLCQKYKSFRIGE